MENDMKLFVAIVKANPRIEIICPDINSMIRDIREQMGIRMWISPGIDIYDHPWQVDWDQEPRQMKRLNRKKFNVWITT